MYMHSTSVPVLYLPAVLSVAGCQRGDIEAAMVTTQPLSATMEKKNHSTGDKTSLTTVLSRERKRQTEAGITDGITGAKRQGQHISREKWMSDGEVSDG